jgi:hypothetical protein
MALPHNILKQRSAAQLGSTAILAFGLLAPNHSTAQSYILNYNGSSATGNVTFNTADFFSLAPPGYPGPTGYANPTGIILFNSAEYDGLVWTMSVSSTNASFSVGDGADPNGVIIQGVSTNPPIDGTSVPDLLRLLGSPGMTLSISTLTEGYADTSPITSFSITEIPEPSAVSLLGVGGLIGAGLCWMYRRGTFAEIGTQACK